MKKLTLVLTLGPNVYMPLAAAGLVVGGMFLGKNLTSVLPK